ncbi:hypothetical protein SH2C18_48270 [Clostridium sediminicola]|uniref:anti-sigma-V factor rsiV n=1 Tax=Clostridium sediminicola TaxID=3114879 RepID=UPI0031F211AA
MKKYDNFISELGEKKLDMLSSELPEFTDKNLANIKNKFKEKTLPKRKNSKKIIKRVLASAACICAIFVSLVNVNKVFAANLLDIPVISNIVNLVTFDKMALYDEYRHISIEIPSIEGLEDTNVQEEINQILKKRAITVYDKAFENSEKIKKESQEAGFLTSIPETIEQNFKLIRNSDDLLSFMVITTEIAASASETGYYYNVDLKNSKLLTLEDLFNKNYDYINVINNEIILQMNEKNKKEDAAFFIDYFKTIDNNANFYINEDGNLVIVFNEYEIAAGYMGMPEFIIDTSTFGDNISELGYLK